MEGVETLLRMKNMRLFFFLGERKTIRLAAKAAGISIQHATRLLKKWRKSGLVEKSGLYGHKYEYTAEGNIVRNYFSNGRCLL